MITSEQSPRQEENDAAGPFDMAAVDYCYQGSSVDPATGEVIDFFVLCPEDGAEKEMAWPKAKSKNLV